MSYIFRFSQLKRRRSVNSSLCVDLVVWKLLYIRNLAYNFILLSNWLKRIDIHVLQFMYTSFAVFLQNLELWCYVIGCLKWILNNVSFYIVSRCLWWKCRFMLNFLSSTANFNVILQPKNILTKNWFLIGGNCSILYEAYFLSGAY